MAVNIGIDPPSLQEKDKANKKELPFYTSKFSDWKVDNREKTSSIWEVSSKEVSGYEFLHGIELTKFMSLIPIDVSIVKDPEQRYLCITYGPMKRPFYIYLDFSQHPRETLEEWERAIRRIMGQDPRVRSQSTVTRRPQRTIRPSSKTKSALPSSQPLLTRAGEVPNEQPTKDDQPADASGEQACAAPNEQPPEEDQAADPSDEQAGAAPNEQPSEETSFQEGEDGSVDGILSQPSSLRSLDDTEWFKRDYRISTLQKERDQPHVDLDIQLKSLMDMKLSLADYKDGVYVSDVGGPCSCNLNIGDRILQITSQPVKNAQDAREKIYSITDDDTKVAVRLQRFPIGNLCVIHSDVRSWPQLGIDVDGSKITEMSPAGAFRRSCDPKLVWFEEHQSERSISSINERPISFHSTSHEVQNVIFEACNQEGSMVFHVHPTEFLNAISPDSTKL